MYYIIYKSYTDYTQFEGSWDIEYEKFDSLSECIATIQEYKENHNITGIIGPLKLILP